MLVKYIDSNYIIETLQKPSWGEVEEPDFYITMASNRVKALIFPSEQGDPNNLASYNEEQQEAIKLATAIYTLWYFDTNYDFTNGSVSVNFGGVSMSESKTYNGEMVLPNVFDILKQANLIPTTETFIFNNTSGSFDNVNINPEAFKDLQQEMERQADNNIRQDREIVKIYDRLSRVPTNEEQEHLKLEVEEIQKEQEVQNENIQANTNKTTDLQNQITENIEDIAAINEEVSTNKTDIANLGNKVNANEAAIQTNTNKIQENKNNITALDGRLLSVSGLLNQTIDGLRTLRPFKFVGLYDSSRTYMINEMVSKDDKFYLSLEDNNTTTPPGDKWLIMKEFQQVDLSDYPTKLEVDSIKTDLQNKITANTTNITTNKNNIDKLNNEVVKIAGQQIITGKKIFTGPGEGIQIRPNATGGSSYITGYDFEGKTKKWVLGNTGKNEGMLLEAPLGDIYLKPGANGNIQCYNKLVRQVADPTNNTDAANKRYVDTAIANAAPTGLVNRIQSLETNTVKLTGDQRIQGNKIIEHATIVYGEVSQLSTANKELSLVNKKYVDDAINTAIGNNSGIADLANQLTTINQTLEEHEFEINSYGSLIQTNIDSITRNRVNIAANGRNIESNTSKIESNTNQITYLKSHTVTNDTDQTINGQKTFAYKIFANGGITNLPLPTNTNDAANKQYVDNKTSLYTMFSSNTIYNNLQKITTRLFDNSAVDYLKPLTVSFTRTNTSGTDYGSYTFQIQYGIGENNFVVGSNLYYDRSKTYGQLGDWVALTITPSYIQVQCWNSGDRIKNIKVQGWKKV